MLLNPKETGDTAGNKLSLRGPQSSTDFPEAVIGQEESEEEEEEKDEEGETGSEDKLTTLATWAVWGRFEWSRAKIVYSERKAGSAIIPASIWPRQCSNGTEKVGGKERNTESNEKKNNTMIVKPHRRVSVHRAVRGELATGGERDRERERETAWDWKKI